jgi:hypothetical protein
MKTLIAALFAAGVSLTVQSAAQAIPAAPLAEAAKETSSVVEVQVERGRNKAGGCKRGYRHTRNGCRKVTS